MGHELTRYSSGNTQPQSSQLIGPLLTDAGRESGISVRELISTLNQKSAGGEWMVEHSPKILASEKRPLTTIIDISLDTNLSGVLAVTVRSGKSFRSSVVPVEKRDDCTFCGADFEQVVWTVLFFVLEELGSVWSCRRLWHGYCGTFCTARSLWREEFSLVLVRDS